MSLQNMLTDESWVENAQGLRAGPFKTRFGGSELTFFDPSFDAAEGDNIIQKLPNGKERRFEVLSTQYRTGLGPIPASWVVGVQMGVAPAKTPPQSVSYNISGHNVQVGNHNAQHITSTFQALIADIDRAPFSDEQKAEAKSRLRLFLESPVTAAVLGGLAQGVIGTLG